MFARTMQTRCASSASQSSAVMVGTGVGEALVLEARGKVEYANREVIDGEDCYGERK